MKLRLIIQIILLIIVLFINDSLYVLKNRVETYLSDTEQKSLQKIEKEPAVVIINDNNLERAATNISNQYFVEEVKTIPQSELVDILTEQYHLTDSKALLGELGLPRVFEIYFSASRFREVESGLFLKNIQEQQGILRLLYSEDNYRNSWEMLEFIQGIRKVIEDYWLYFYYGFGMIFLISLLMVRLDTENRKVNYWLIYQRAGGAMIFRTVSRILTSILTLLLPVAAAFVLEYFLAKELILPVMPEIKYHILRFAAGLLISFSALLIARRKEYV
ncbi:MAG: hypothetical protein K9N06_12525 [Candidatus Cloacimonetes bacterium]|nr:hypothetical protein [Candidatus Cloacimonadota bacterium]